MINLTKPGDVARAGKREWLGLAILVLPAMLVSMDSSIIYLALPAITEDLSANATQQLWIVDIYNFAVAGFLPTMGTLGDKFGRRRVLLAGASGFALMSTLSAFSSSAAMLIICRGFLGVAGAALMPSVLALLRTIFQDERQRTLAIAVCSSCFTLGTIVGPVAGGVILTTSYWGWIFLLGTPVMLVLLILGPFIIPESQKKTTGPIDLRSVALSFVAVLPTTYFIKEIASHGWHPLAALAATIGIPAAIWFVLRQLKSHNPLLDLRLLSDKACGTILGITCMTTGAVTGLLYFMTVYYQLVNGISALQASFLIIPQSIASIIGIQISPRLLHRIGYRYVLAAGLLVATLGCALLTLAQDGSPIGITVAAGILICLGVSPQPGIATVVLMSRTESAHAGSAAAMSEIAIVFGAASGLAVLGSMGNALYRGVLNLPSLLPENLTQMARENIQGAMVSARELPISPLADETIRQSGLAFTFSMNVAAGVTGAVFLVICTLLMAGRRARQSHDSD